MNNITLIRLDYKGDFISEITIAPDEFKKHQVDRYTIWKYNDRLIHTSDTSLISSMSDSPTGGLLILFKSGAVVELDEFGNIIGMESIWKHIWRSVKNIFGIPPKLSIDSTDTHYAVLDDNNIRMVDDRGNEIELCGTLEDMLGYQNNKKDTDYVVTCGGGNTYIVTNTKVFISSKKTFNVILPPTNDDLIMQLYISSRLGITIYYKNTVTGLLTRKRMDTYFTSLYAVVSNWTIGNKRRYMNDFNQNDIDKCFNVDSGEIKIKRIR